MERDEMKRQLPRGIIVVGKHCGLGDTALYHTIETIKGRLIASTWGEPNEAVATLYAEAHNVALRSKMWPQEMLDRIKDLERRLSEIREQGLDNPI